MPEQVRIEEDIFQANNAIAEQNRKAFDRAGVFTINLIASPGAGKTSLIEQTVKILSNQFHISVINGDLATQLDRDRAEAAGAIALNINTGGDCHLDAIKIKTALTQLNLSTLDLIIIENVGNLICPASFQLGVHKMAVIASVPEGDDKPYKYPGTFLEADLVVLNKIDLLPYVPFDKNRFLKGLHLLNSKIEVFELSCLKGNGIGLWCDWLVNQIKKQKSTGCSNS
jgi:hydrogenase nickel incorporation protein HypB